MRIAAGEVEEKLPERTAAAELGRMAPYSSADLRHDRGDRDA
jgi:hypothetical protein